MRIPFLLALAGALGSSSPSYGQSPVPLSQLVAEALQNNPDLKAGEHTWLAATQMTMLPAV
ncbi:MAG: hypothetical protein ABSE57_25215 [Bryobacteraceae bacterium]|jgi:outer membrane protein TolC